MLLSSPSISASRSASSNRCCSLDDKRDKGVSNLAYSASSSLINLLLESLIASFNASLNSCNSVSS